MERAIKEWLLEDNAREKQSRTISPKSMKFSYTIYGCMLLLHPGTFGTSQWRAATCHCGPEDFERLYQLIAKHLKITHIAINRPIPAQQENGMSDNIIRSPFNFTPLYGYFGPTTCHSPPSRQDFDSAFWVTAKQNGIFQTWAPRWTMFSRGNISEKARLLSLPSLGQAVEEGTIDGQGCTAIDLYAGIGYFALSYAKAGFDKVLCWDLNPWSIEGLRRGAAANKWSTVSYSDHPNVEHLTGSDAKFLVFNESNERATGRLRQMKDCLPPVRHVNCGLLPTSRGSWQTALGVLDSDLGGWIHIHENFAVNEIEQKAQKVRTAFQTMVDSIRTGIIVEVESVSRIKSYAPGVIHCVLDIHIPPSRRD